MDTSDLRKLNRKELLEILLEQTTRIEDLEAELEKVSAKVDSKKISINETGSIAEASLKLTDIFKAADEAVEIYKQNAIEQLKKEEKEQKKELKETKAKVLALVEEKCRRREAEAEKKVKKLEERLATLVKDEQKIKAEKNVKKKIETQKSKTAKRKFKK